MPGWSTADIGDQSGKVAVVTGANSGIGLATADALASAGATGVMACRNQAKGEQARQGISEPDRAAVGSLDLGDRDSIGAFASWFAERYDQLDLLISNAGVMATPAELTADGVERQWATNHLGHYILTGLLIERLLATDLSRVVTVASLAANSGDLAGYDPTTLTGYRRFRAYANSKLANLVFTVELDRRLRDRSAGTIAVAAHPGMTSTNLAIGFGSTLLARAARAVGRLTMQPASQGALPTLRAATDPHVEGGQWYGPAGRGQYRGPPVAVALPTAATDPATGQELWRQSAGLANLDYLPLAG